MRLRPIRPEDAAALTQLYDRLSPESAYQRFFTVMRRLPPDWARILAGVDHDRNAAIVAAGPDGGLVGVARYGTLPGADEAEIALVVEDGWQHRGLGTILLSALLEHAESRGITPIPGLRPRRQSADAAPDRPAGPHDRALARPGCGDPSLHTPPGPGPRADGARAHPGNGR